MIPFVKVIIVVGLVSIIAVPIGFIMPFSTPEFDLEVDVVSARGISPNEMEVNVVFRITNKLHDTINLDSGTVWTYADENHVVLLATIDIASRGRIGRKDIPPNSFLEFPQTIFMDVDQITVMLYIVYDLEGRIGSGGFHLEGERPVDISKLVGQW